MTSDISPEKDISSPKRKPLALIILDGWGHREATENNAIFHASTPTWDSLLAQQPHTLIATSGTAVGLPEGQMGNSEVGHMTLGAGRVVYQNLSRIANAIDDGSFFSNDAYCAAVDNAIKKNKAVHIVGLLSPGGVHSHEDHFSAMIDLAAQRGAKRVFVHAFLDGRDTPPKSAATSLEKIDKQLRSAGVGCIASLCGRFYALDRDKRWDRVQLAYDLLTQGKSEFTAADAISGLHAAYDRNENDEFVKPTVIAAKNETAITIDDDDSVIFMNFRADRAREISHALTDTDFDGFQRTVVPQLGHFVMTTEYEESLKLPCAFPSKNLNNSLGEVLASLDKTQLRIAETEKYAHVTFFYSGGRESLYAGEERILIPSPNVETYDLQPEMSAPELTQRLVTEIHSGKHDVIVCNYANGDMVGHSGVYAAALKAAEAVDSCLAQVIEAIRQTGAQCLITADHGNVEMMRDASDEAHTQHTTGPVSLIYVGEQDISFADGGTLADVAPTMLRLMNLQQPSDMTGRSLIKE